MCGRFVLIQKIEVLEKRFGAPADSGTVHKPSYNIGIGATSVIVTNEEQKEIKNAVFGFTPHWSKKQMYLFNARSEGDRNKENNPDYKGSRDIINKPAFRKAIRSSRCLIPADAFIEGTTNEGLSKPYVVYLKNKERPFCFAGIYNKWRNPNNNEIITGFAIITTVANELLQKIPHHRSPVIIPAKYEHLWLDKSVPLFEITDLLIPYDYTKMNAYPISNEIKSLSNNYSELLNPVGETVFADKDINVINKIENQGFGRKNRHF